MSAKGTAIPTLPTMGRSRYCNIYNAHCGQTKVMQTVNYFRKTKVAQSTAMFTTPTMGRQRCCNLYIAHYGTYQRLLWADRVLQSMFCPLWADQRYCTVLSHLLSLAHSFACSHVLALYSCCMLSFALAYFFRIHLNFCCLWYNLFFLLSLVTLLLSCRLHTVLMQVPTLSSSCWNQLSTSLWKSWSVPSLRPLMETRKFIVPSHYNYPPSRHVSFGVHQWSVLGWLDLCLKCLECSLPNSSSDFLHLISCF